MLSLSHITTTGFLFLILSANLNAEVVNYPNYGAKTSEFSVKVPGRGMTKSAVQNRFGDADDKYAAVGEPPISKWAYKNFTVYFEHQYVLHSVVHN